MTTIEKLLAKVRNSPSGITFDELCRLADRSGFVFRRQGGSHKVYKHKIHGMIMNFQPDRNGMAKAYQVKQLLEFIDMHKEDENV